MVRARILAVVGASLVLLAACSSQYERLGQVRQKISSVGMSHNVVPTNLPSGHGYAESAVGWVAVDLGNEQGARIIAHINNYAGPINQNGFPSYDSWGWAPRPGIQWTFHNEADAGYWWGLPPEPATGIGHCSITIAKKCNPLNNKCPQGQSCVSEYAAPRGDPGITGVGWANVVVAVAASSSKDDAFSNPSDIVLVTSNDGGDHFGAGHGEIHLLTQTAPGCPTGGGGGVVDQPVIAADPDTHEVFVWWRQLATNSPCGDFAWTRRARIDANGGVTLFPANAIPILAGVNLTSFGFANITVAPAWGSEPQKVYMAFFDHDPFRHCPSSATTPMTWYVASSTNQGVTWFPQNVHAVHFDPKWPYCIGTTSPTRGLALNDKQKAIA